MALGPKELQPWTVPEIETQEEFTAAYNELLIDAGHAAEFGDTAVALDDRERMDRLAAAYPGYAERIGAIVLFDNDN